MRIAVDFHDERLDFEVADDRLVGHRGGPVGPPAPDPSTATRAAIDGPRGFPPLARAVVPGDRVVIPFDPETPDPAAILGAVAEVLRAAEVESITVVSTGPAPAGTPEGLTWTVHDPDDRAQLAYLATTQEGHRVYLNKLLIDADIVVPIGALGYDPALGYRGPWSVIYPGQSDREMQSRYRAAAASAEAPPDRDRPGPLLLESSEVSWLLGCQFHLGVVPGVSGTASVVAGLESAVRAHGAAAVDEAWTFRVAERADVVIAGIGAPGRPTSIDDLANGLDAAGRLVRRGGKVVALSRARGEPGPAFRRIIAAGEPRVAVKVLRGHEADPDFLAARRIAATLAWADVYLHSALDPDLVDDLGMIPLDRPEEARKLAAAAASCTLIGQADRTRVLVDGEGD